MNDYRKDLEKIFRDNGGRYNPDSGKYYTNCTIVNADTVNISFRNDDAVYDAESGSPHDRLIALTLMLKQATKEKWKPTPTWKLRKKMIDALNDCYKEYTDLFGVAPQKHIIDIFQPKK